MAGGKPGDEFNSQEYAVEDLLSEVKSGPNRLSSVESSDERVLRSTLRGWTQGIATQLEKTLTQQLDISRDMRLAARTIADDQQGRAAVATLKAIHEEVQQMRTSSHVNESVLFAIQEVRDVTREGRVELQGIRAAIDSMSELIEKLTMLLSNGHGAHH
jgi:hypothetical protein